MASIEITVTSIAVLAFLLTYFSLAGATTYASQGKASSVVVVGKVFCDTCLEDRLSENGYVISGASIAVECELNRKMMTISFLGKTDENGEFRLELPSDIFQSTDQLNNCWARPRNSPYDSCNIPRISEPPKLSLQSASNGVVTYSAGSFSYRHETVPPSCYSEDLLAMIRGRAMTEDVDQSSKAGQRTPTIPSLPPASLPSVPPLPKFTIPPLPSVPPLPKTPPLPSIPPLPKMSPLPSAPPLPKISPLPQFSVPPLPKISPLPGAPPLPKISPLPHFSVPPLPKMSPLPSAPPLPKISPLPQLSVPPLPKTSPLPSAPTLPKIAPLPQLSVPPLPKTPPLPQLSFPPFPKPTIPGSPPIPQIPNFQFPPIPFLTPPPPSH
eukprot:PITA_03404